MNGGTVSPFEGNAHAAVDDSRDQNGDFERRYLAARLCGELHDQLVVTLQCPVADDNAAATGTLHGKKEPACAEVRDLTSKARAALDPDLGLYL
jgi:hypothetical protein